MPSDELSASGKLSKKEALKSVRDAVLASLGLLLPQLLDIANITDFGGYGIYASIALMIITPFINRFINIWRV